MVCMRVRTCSTRLAFSCRAVADDDTRTRQATDVKQTPGTPFLGLSTLHLCGVAPRPACSRPSPSDSPSMPLDEWLDSNHHADIPVQTSIYA